MCPCVPIIASILAGLHHKISQMKRVLRVKNMHFEVAHDPQGPWNTQEYLKGLASKFIESKYLANESF